MSVRLARALLASLALSTFACNRVPAQSADTSDASKHSKTGSILVSKTAADERLYVVGHRTSVDTFLTTNDFDVQVRRLEDCSLVTEHHFKDTASEASYDVEENLLIIASAFDFIRISSSGKAQIWMSTSELDSKRVWAGSILDVTRDYALVSDSTGDCFAKISLTNQGQIERIGTDQSSPISKFLDARIQGDALAVLGTDISKKTVFMRKSSTAEIEKIASFSENVTDAAFTDDIESVIAIDASHRIWLITNKEPRQIYKFDKPGRWVSRSSNRYGVALWMLDELMIYRDGVIASTTLDEGHIFSILLTSKTSALGTVGAPYAFIRLQINE